GVVVADADLLEEGAAVRVGLGTALREPLPVAVEHLLRALVAAEREIAVVVSVIDAPVPGLDRAEPRDPDRRVRLLDRLRPEVHVPQLGVLSVSRERLARRPRLHDEFRGVT